ncbi:MAG: hypothetical protein QOE45_501 [Frankiaceae bacterium]|jgi:hypothetical protein|nr:hypothetical protein [Frankiaceae bacterium]
MGYPLNDMGKALTSQIYHTVMGGDDTVQPPKNTFFTWAMPGLPFTEADLDFCAKGIYSAPTAEEMNTRLSHAFALSMLLDFIPDAGAPYSNDRQEGMYKPDAEKRLSEMYRQILRFSKVVSTELTDKEKQKLEQLRGKLFVTKKVTDLVTDEVKEVIEESPLLRAYNEKMAAYLAATTEYNAKRAAAAGATGPEGKAAVADWSMNAQTYALKVKAAADAWTSGGYRNDVDEINAFINQTTERSMVLWKQSLEEAYEKGVVTSTEVPIPFRYTTLVPGNIATAGGWTNLGVSHLHQVSTTDESSTSWNAGGGVNFGLFSASGGVNSTKTEVDGSTEVESFRLSFDLAQAVIVRPWFYPEWFANRGWTLRKGEGWNFSDLPSDGGAPPKGEFIGYATQAIFVRNVEIESKEFVSKYHDVKSHVDANASVGWGPFRLSGGYAHDEHHNKTESTDDGQTLKVGGMQIIGFVNHLIGKAPNPLEELKDADFV